MVDDVVLGVMECVMVSLITVTVIRVFMSRVDIQRKHHIVCTVLSHLFQSRMIVTINHL